MDYKVRKFIEGVDCTFGIRVTDNSRVNVRVIKFNGQKVNSNRLYSGKSLLNARIVIDGLVLQDLIDKGIREYSDPGKPKKSRRKKDKTVIVVRAQHYKLEKYVGGMWIKVCTSYLMDVLRNKAKYSDLKHRVTPTSASYVKIPKDQYLTAVQNGLLVFDEANIKANRHVHKKASGRSRKYAKISNDSRVRSMTKYVK